VVNSEDLCKDRKIKLTKTQWILKGQDGENVLGSSEHGTDPSGCIIFTKFVESLSNYRLLKTGSGKKLLSPTPHGQNPTRARIRLSNSHLN
jgi:hypothetical protein